MATKDITIARGSLYFDQFLPGTMTGTGFRPLGACPEAQFTFDVEKLEHQNMEFGIGEIDKSVIISIARSGNMILEEIIPENLSLFMMSAAGAQTITTAGSTVAAEPINGVIPGRRYQLGQTRANPMGAVNIAYPGAGATLFEVTNDAAQPVTYALGIDYEVDPRTGMLLVIVGGAIAKGTNLRVGYTTIATTFSQVVSGATQVEGALMYISKNPTGPDYKYLLPYVSMAPDGDFGLKSEEWQQIPLTFDILRQTDREAIYLNGLTFQPNF